VSQGTINFDVCIILAVVLCSQYRNKLMVRLDSDTSDVTMLSCDQLVYSDSIYQVRLSVSKAEKKHVTQQDSISLRHIQNTTNSGPSSTSRTFNRTRKKSLSSQQAAYLVCNLLIYLAHILTLFKCQGVGANRPTVAHVAMHVPSPTLHAMMAGGAATIVTPKVNPAAA
jgi:hypothetical protein